MKKIVLVVMAALFSISLGAQVSQNTVKKLNLKGIDFNCVIPKSKEKYNISFEKVGEQIPTAIVTKFVPSTTGYKIGFQVDQVVLWEEYEPSDVGTLPKTAKVTIGIPMEHLFKLEINLKNTFTNMRLVNTNATYKMSWYEAVEVNGRMESSFLYADEGSCRIKQDSGQDVFISY